MTAPFELPPHWRTLPLQTVATCNDSVVDEATPDDWELLYVDISSVDGAIGITSKEAMRFSEAPSRARRRVRHGDVIISTVRTYLRAIAPVVDPEPNLVVSTGFAVVRPTSDLNPRFLGYLLSSSYFVDEVIARSAGASYPAINARDLMRIPVSVPPIENQQLIAEFLDEQMAAIDALLSEQGRLIDLLGEKRQALISHAVTKGLNPDAPMKDSGIDVLGSIPLHWELRRVRTTADFLTSGPRGWSSRIVDDGGCLFIQSGDLDDSMHIDFSSAQRVEVGEDAEAARTRLRSGDVLVCITGAKTGKVGVCLAVPERAHINQHLCLIRPKSSVDPLYLGMCLNSVVGREHFRRSQYGLKQGLSLGDVAEAPVPCPPISEQHAILTHLNHEFEALTHLQAEAERAAEILHERRTALITAAVTGQIDVRGSAYADAASDVGSGVSVGATVGVA